MAVYSEADQHALHVQEADQPISLEAQKYLKLFKHGSDHRDCRQTNTDAIHPG
ncbi:biotin carboxylase N-terminal domain-containing protein [Bacillus sp. SL00103]